MVFRHVHSCFPTNLALALATTKTRPIGWNPPWSRRCTLCWASIYCVGLTKGWLKTWDPILTIAVLIHTMCYHIQISIDCFWLRKTHESHSKSVTPGVPKRTGAPGASKLQPMALTGYIWNYLNIIQYHKLCHPLLGSVHRREPHIPHPNFHCISWNLCRMSLLG